ncbi:uncharacterized protein LOC143576407 [Bidens hawaiensis]|uniref:uncharacterized protein LOC143576407 n=1 Tax=Bidens hawaiensis TaxID=980011 RepID=UPI00404ACB03
MCSTNSLSSRLKQEKIEAQYGKFLELFKQFHINLPFIEAISQMQKYEKFLKQVLSHKRKLEELSHVILSEECSAILQNKLPKKMTDPGSFTIPCLIGNLFVSNDLVNLGASINLMPYTVFSKLRLREPTPTRMSIQLADRSVKYPRGIVENMLVKIDKFVFPADFVILDMDEDNYVPIILGRPFLGTARALIDVYTGKPTLRVEDEEKEADAVNSDAQVVFQEKELEESNSEETFEIVNRDLEPKAKPSIKDPPTLELKELPKHLEYSFLEGNSRLPVIISSDLSSDEKERPHKVLKSHKKGIVWKIMYMKGFNS